jgi:DNA polymerase-1
MAIANLDYSNQEFLIAGALSGDDAMLEDYAAGDVYVAFAKRIELVPLHATKESHPEARAKAKALVLGIGYGMGAWGLRVRLGTTEEEAAEMIAKYWSAYPDYDAWRSELASKMQVDGYLELADGWRLFPVLDCNQRSIMNFPMQGTGANILRRACTDLAAAGVAMIGTNHDSIMIQAPVDDIDRQVSLTKNLMVKASRALLNGHACRVDVEQVVRYPDHWDPEAGRDLYQQLIAVCK